MLAPLLADFGRLLSVENAVILGPNIAVRRKILSLEHIKRTISQLL
jgi:hypothetical protein